MLRKCHLASLAVAGVASLAVISSAHADGYEPAGKAMAAPVVDYGWGGLYVGVGIGGAQFDNGVGVDAWKKTQKQGRHRNCRRVYRYGRWQVECQHWSPWTNHGDPWTKHKSAHFSDDEWNVFGTVQVGYDHLFGKSVLAGVFGDFDFFPDSEHSFSMPWIKHYHGKDHKVGSFDGNIDLEHIWSVGVRGGFLVMPHWLIYGAGGYSQAEVDGSIDVTFKNHYGRGTVLSMSAEDDLEGYFLEGGTEFKLHRNVALRLAYRRYEFDSGSASASAHKVSHAICRGSFYDACTRQKRFVKGFKSNAGFDDSEIHSIRATLVIGLNPVPQAVVPLK